MTFATHVSESSSSFLGAGSSMSCGMPSVSAIDDEMKRWSREWKHEPEFSEGTGRGIFNDVWEIVESYFSRIRARSSVSA
jgi:hypothetical protein